MENEEIVGISSDKIKEMVIAKLPDFLAEAMESKYDSPLKKAVEQALKDNEGAIKKLVNEVLVNVLNEPKFKEALGQQMMAKVIEKGLRG